MDIVQSNYFVGFTVTVIGVLSGARLLALGARLSS